MKKQQVDQELQHDTILKLKKNHTCANNILVFNVCTLPRANSYHLIWISIGGGCRGRRQVMGIKKKGKNYNKNKGGRGFKPTNPNIVPQKEWTMNLTVYLKSSLIGPLTYKIPEFP